MRRRRYYEAEIPEHLRSSDDRNQYTRAGEPVPFNDLSKEQQKEALAFMLDNYTPSFERWITGTAFAQGSEMLEAAANTYLKETGIDEILRIRFIRPLRRDMPGSFNTSTEKYADYFQLGLDFIFTQAEKEKLNATFAGKKYDSRDKFNIRSISSFGISSLGADTTINNVSFAINKTKGAASYYNASKSTEGNISQEIKAYFIEVLKNLFDLDPTHVLQELYEVCLRANEQNEQKAGDVLAKRKYFYDILSHESDKHKAGVIFSDSRQTVIDKICNMNKPKKSGNGYEDVIERWFGYFPDASILGN